jgi:hypothetical protein
VPSINTAFPSLRRRRRREMQQALADLFADMRADVKSRVEVGVSRKVAKDWDVKLAALLEDQNMLTAAEVAGKVADALAPARAEGEYDPEVMRGWLQVNAQVNAELINRDIEAKVATALGDDDDDDEDAPDPVDAVFDIQEEGGASSIAVGAVTMAAGFAARDAGRAVAEAPVKTWVVTSGNPRPQHAAMNGETVGIDDRFSNGLMWPGDPEGTADDNAECLCALTISG